MTQTAPSNEGETVPGAHLAGAGLIKPGYHPRLTNDDLAPLKTQSWSSYNIFAFWMSDVHSVGGYVTAGSLFALGLTSWQVLVALVVGIAIVNVFANLVAKPSQVTGVPYPVMCRSAFGVLGANVPAIIRGLIAVAWYGIQTYLASHAFVILGLKIWPGLAPWADVHEHGFLGLSALGWAGFMTMWVLQALVFWRGMESIRKFIDFCGPAVYVVMLMLAIYLISEAGWSNISLNLGEVNYTGWSAVPVVLGAIALVVSYFSGPMLNFGDFSRYGKTFGAVKRGNFLGLLTFIVATIGINIVANFVSPAFDFSHVSPQRISWRTGGMIAAVGSVLITPWNLYNNPEVIHYTLETLGAFIGPLFGILIADYYLVRRQRVILDDMFTMSESGTYWYKKGYNPAAIISTVVGALVAMIPVILKAQPFGLDVWGMAGAAQYSWFLGMGVGFVCYLGLSAGARRANRTAPIEA